MDGHLASRNIVGLTSDSKTICLASRLLHEPFSVLAPLLGHELAHTVQLEKGGDDSVDFLEAEAWEASRAALLGQRFSITGAGSRPLAAAGLFRTEAARDFIEMFGIDPLKAKGNTAKIDPLTFEKILDLMTVKFKNEDDFIIDAHGTANGFHIDIAKGEQAQATTLVLSNMQQIADLRSALTKAGNNLDELRKIEKDKLKILELGAPPDPNNKAAVQAAIQEAKQKIESKITDMKNSAGVQDEAVITRLVKKMADLKNKQRNRIELRACNMGINQGVMDFYRVLFNAKILRAATNFSAFGYFIPVAPRNEASYKTFVKQQGQVFLDKPKAGGKFAFAYIPKPNAQADTPSAADSDQAVLNWIKEHIGGGSNLKADKFPSHFLLTARPAFPLDTEYTSNIMESKAP